MSTLVLAMSTLIATSSLGALLLGRTRLAILALLVEAPERRLYLRQIVRLTGAAQGGVQRELAFLVRAGILSKTREANLAYFQANRTAPIYEELRGLVRKTAGTPELLRAALLPQAPSITRAFVYGSVARGEEGAASDIDLMVIGDVSFFDVVAAVSPLQQALGREINPTVFDSSEYARRLRAKDPFLTRVEKQPRIDLLGGNDDARSMA
jgi:predicted nucleotidyltransferase